MSAAGWIEAFLEMMAVERAAARNTLTAYAKDLEDAQGFLAGRGRDLADAAAISPSTSARDSTLGRGRPFFGASTRREGSSLRQPSPSTKR